jgi:hypothetical protein
VGDELISIDGQAVGDLMAAIAAQLGDGNPRGAQRFAAALLTNHEQEFIPKAHQIGDTASLLLHRGDGSMTTITLPWIVSGSAYTFAGPVPSPSGGSVARAAASAGTSAMGTRARPRWPSYMNHARQRQQFLSRQRRFVAGFGELHPVFNLPDSFVQRLGRGRTDEFFTGTFDAGGYKLGYLRAADFEFFGGTALQREIAYMDANTDGLVVDVMRNPGGFGCDAEDLAQLLHPNGFHSLGIALRVSWFDILSTRQDIQDAQDFGATDAEIAELQVLLAAYEDAFAKSRGLTVSLPLCSASQDVPPFKDKNGKLIAYSGPILVLTDDFTASAAELFSAIMQDNGRATLYGFRTDGAGGAVSGFNAGQYSETGLSLAIGILIRQNPVVTMDYPAAPYIENIGVRPDVTADYQTVDNLLNLGKTFVDGFTAALVARINAGQQ